MQGLSLSQLYLRFNPRTHTGCDYEIRYGLLRLLRVSIHAPTRGATVQICERSDEYFLVSIHAPTRGATSSTSRCRIVQQLFQSTHPHGVRPIIIVNIAFFGYRCFNPRTHTGCDSSKSWKYPGARVSIHAPTRGATSRRSRYYLRKPFQSTHPHGVRLRRTDVMAYPAYLFQSTHPHGVRPGRRIPCTGSCSVSIHAPTRGATVGRTPERPKA